MRVFAQIALLVSEDASQEQKLVDVNRVLDDYASTTAAVHQSMFRELDPSTTDYAVPFGGVTLASHVLVLAFKEIRVKFNGAGSPALVVKPKVAAAEGVAISTFQKFDVPGFWFGSMVNVSSIYVTNPSGSAKAGLFVALVGDAS